MTPNALFISGFITNFQSILGIEYPDLESWANIFTIAPSDRLCPGTQNAQP